MTAALPTPPTPTSRLTFDAVAEAAGLAETYARAAQEFAAVGDTKGLCYAVRQAAVALQAASSAALALRPSTDGGAR